MAQTGHHTHPTFSVATLWRRKTI